MEKASFYLWLALGAACLAGVVTGHFHHIATLSICATMALICKPKTNKRHEHQS